LIISPQSWATVGFGRHTKALHWCRCRRVRSPYSRTGRVGDLERSAPAHGSARAEFRVSAQCPAHPTSVAATAKAFLSRRPRPNVPWNSVPSY
jgi:hypothetical protein